MACVKENIRVERLNISRSESLVQNYLTKFPHRCIDVYVWKKNWKTDVDLY